VGLSFTPPSGPQMLPPEKMSARARVHAVWLALRAGWPIDPETWAFDPVTSTTVVVTDAGVVWGHLWALDAEQGEQLIEDRYGPDGRERARRAVG
jgi:hypothetical protein